MSPTTRPTQAEAVAARWAEKHPDLRSRIERALALVPRVQYLGEDTYEVPGSRGQTYYVGIDPRRHTSTCTCEDTARGNHCKHRLAVALVWTVSR
jgi:hypothetical protein